jgi:hypothetical protein
MPYYRYEPQSMLENSSYKLCYDRYVITDRTSHNNRPDVVVRDKTVREAYWVDVSVPNNHSLLSTVTQELQKFTE